MRSEAVIRKGTPTVSVFISPRSTRTQLIFFGVTRLIAVTLILAVCHSQLINVDDPMRWLCRPLGIALSLLTLSYLVTVVPSLSFLARRRWYLVWSAVLALLTAWVLGAVFAVSEITAALGAHTILADCPELTSALILMVSGASLFAVLAARTPVPST